MPRTLPNINLLDELPSSTSSPCCVIETVWQNVEPFLDLKSTIRFSEACKSLHKIIVDQDTQKLRVSCFSVAKYIFLIEADDPVNTIPHYLAHALNSIHFPSLRRALLSFPKTRPRNGVERDFINDEITACFPTFVSNLSSAQNLELLKLCIDPIVASENSGYVESLIELFGRNLFKCRKLKTLSIWDRDYERYGSEDSAILFRKLLEAITPKSPTSQRSLEALELYFPRVLKYSLGETDEASVSALLEYCGAVISSSEMRSLSVAIADLRFCAKSSLDSSIKIDQANSTLKNIHDLDVNGYLNDQSLLPWQFLDFFSASDSLSSITLTLTWNSWENRFEDLKSMLRSKKLSSVYLSCDYHDDSEGELLRLLDDLCDTWDKDGINMSLLRVTNVLNADGTQLFNLIKKLERIGLNSIDLSSGSADDDNTFMDSVTEESGPINIEYFFAENTVAAITSG